MSSTRASCDGGRGDGFGALGLPDSGLLARPGRTVVVRTVGGGVKPYDADLDAALRREVMDGIGAAIGVATEFLILTEPGGRVTVVQHYFHADVLDMDPNRRSGPELDAPDAGDFSPVRGALDASAVAVLELHRSNSPATCVGMPRRGRLKGSVTRRLR